MKRAAAWILAILAAAAFAQGKPRPLPLPDVSGSVELRVAYVHNPRFPALPASRLDVILALTAAHLAEHFKVKVAFSRPVELPIIKLFAAMDPRMVALAEKQRLDGAVNQFAVERLARGLLADLKADGDVPAQKRFAAPHLVQPPADSTDAAFARALINTQLALLRGWQQLKGNEGQPLIGADRYNEYTYWNLLGSAPLPYEVLVTNQLIASAEWEGNSVHSALRGGVSNGVTTQNREGRFRLYSVVSTFPFLDDSPQTVRLRGGDTPSAAEADNHIALLLAHELGHQLLHLGHPFANPHCLMTPPQVLRFRQWAAELSAARCPVGPAAQEKQNRPGFVKFLPVEAAFK